MAGMKRTARPQTRNCAQHGCQRFDVVPVRLDLTHPVTGDLVTVTLRYCEAHAPEVWDLQHIRQAIADALA